MKTLLLVLMLAGIGITEDVKPLPETTQLKVLKAQHDFDDLVGQEKDAQLQFNQAIATQQNIQKTYPELDKKTVAAGKFLETVEEDAIKELGLDPGKYAFDIKTMTAVPKATTAQVTPPPAKK